MTHDLCEVDDCIETAVLGGRCRKHMAALSTAHRSELLEAQSLLRVSQDLRRRSRRNAAAATSFGVAGAALALSLGGGGLGVMFISGIVSGVYFLFSE